MHYHRRFPVKLLTGKINWQHGRYENSPFNYLYFSHREREICKKVFHCVLVYAFNSIDIALHHFWQLRASGLNWSEWHTQHIHFHHTSTTQITSLYRRHSFYESNFVNVQQNRNIKRAEGELFPADSREHTFRMVKLPKYRYKVGL